MMYSNKIITVFGGTGFIGRHVVNTLAAQGYRVRIACRHPQSVYKLKTGAVVGQIAPISCDITNADDIARAIDGAWGVINLVGILFEKKRQSFDLLHHEFPEVLAQICTTHKIKRLVHISALGVEKSNARYARSKTAGEQAVHEHYSMATILKPGIVFGADDNFFNMFARMAALFPVLPLIGAGKTLFQPVYVGDVVWAICEALENKDTCGQIYELGGPDVVSFKEILRFILKTTNREGRFLVPLPFWMARINACFLSLMPTPLLTLDQVELLKVDNICHDEACGLDDLHIVPTSFYDKVPLYLKG